MLTEEPLSSSEKKVEKDVVLTIVEGTNKGEKIELKKGICRAVGRSIDEAEGTKVTHVDPILSLDEDSKKVVMQYVSRNFQKEKKRKSPGLIGSFERGADVQLDDAAVSRLHAMIFHDDSGAIGILDLVSRNGTYVNGIEVESKMLKKGDLIKIGGIKIRFE